MNAAKITAKRRSEAGTSGNFARQIANRSASAGVRVSDLAVVIHDDIFDGDNNFDAARNAIVELQNIAVHLSDTQWKVADGDYGAARDAAAKL